ncbi:hypothetical protein TNCT_424281 [Trichonephila clavata]|uniref:Uncharacterized protein n=1 Tax=Trichonephila clavata TaxID=2740835 RepID=A0A8X6LZ87_TRICU|nr:hypothetical protein TNCT_424281 [Trichonephila clavata]
MRKYRSPVPQDYLLTFKSLVQNDLFPVMPDTRSPSSVTPTDRSTMFSTRTHTPETIPKQRSNPPSCFINRIARGIGLTALKKGDEKSGNRIWSTPLVAMTTQMKMNRPTPDPFIWATPSFSFGNGIKICLEHS